MIQESSDPREEFYGRELKVYKEGLENLNEVLKRSVDRFPDKEMLIMNEQRISYGEFYERMLNMASHLQQDYGFKKGDKLAVLSHNTVEFCLSIFAASYLGGVIVPLNTRLQPPEIAYMLKDAQVKVIIVEDVLHETLQKAMVLSGLSAHVIVFSVSVEKKYSEFNQLFEKTETVPPAELSREDPLFIMYTSGTTGTPKGALGTHLGITQNVVNFQKNLGTTDHERCLMSVPLFHVTGLVASLGHMVYIGGTCVIMYQFKTNRFLELLAHEKITYINTVPTIFIFLLNHPNREDYDLSALRLGVTGGAPMAVQTIRELLDCYPHLNFINNYGATECTGSCTFSSPDTAIEKANSVGRLTDIIDWKIADENGEELPRFKSGELWIKGPTVIPEYWNNPEASRTEFVDGYWKTGDVGYVDDDDYFYLKDRKKNMINRGGENIYPSEVENAIYEHPAILEAAVIGVPDDIFGEEVLAVIVTKEGSHVTEEELKTFLSDKLADYKVPKFIRFTEELPRNPSGKILKYQIQEQYKGTESLS